MRASIRPGTRQTVAVNAFVRGAWFLERADLSADLTRIEMTHLTGWVVESGLEQEQPRWEQPNDDRFVVVTSRILPRMTVHHETTETGTVEVTLIQDLSSVGDETYMSGIEQRWDLMLRFPEPQPLEVHSALASDIQDLVSLGVGDAAQFGRVTFQHPAITWESGIPRDTRKGREDLEYFSNWHVKAKSSEPVSKYAHHFTLEHLGGLPGVARWMTVAEKYRTELGRVMATRYNQEMYLEDRIMNCCAALESLDKTRRNADSEHYVDRIKQCVALAGKPFHGLIADDVTEWPRKVLSARNDLAHHNERFRTDGSIGEHLLSQQLFWLFAMCMLRLAEAPDAVFQSITKHSHFHWLTEQAAKPSATP